MRACDNPFRTDRVLGVRYQFTNGDDWDALLARLHDLRYQAAIVGPEGSGKTTLQEDLAARLESQGRSVRWLRLTRENRRAAPGLVKELFAEAAPDDLLFIDGAEQLGFVRWYRLKRRAAPFAGIVINTHTPGWLTTLVSCRTTPEVLRNIVSILVPPSEMPSTERLSALFHEHDGNIRLCLRDLYDVWADDAKRTGFSHC